MFTFYSNSKRDDNQPSLSYIFKVDTSIVSSGSTSSNKFQLALIEDGTYDLTVKSEGLNQDITLVGQGSTLSTESLLTFDSGGPIQIIEMVPNHINGLVKYGYYGGNTGVIQKSNDKRKLIDILQWGAVTHSLPQANAFGAYKGCKNLIQVSATDQMLNGAVMRALFSNCENLTVIENPSGLISLPTGGQSLAFFSSRCYLLNCSLEGLDPNRYLTGNYSMSALCIRASDFNGSVKGTVNSRVTNLSKAWNLATAFTQSLDELGDTQNVTNMNYMLDGCPNWDHSLDSLSFKSLNTADNMISHAISTANVARTLISIKRQAVNSSGTEGLGNNVVFDLGSSLVPPSGEAKEARDYVVTNKVWNFKTGGLDEKEFQFQVDTTVSGETSNVRFLLPLIDSETYDFEVEIDSGTTQWVGLGSSFTTKYIEFNSSGVKDVIIRENGTDTTAPLKFNFQNCLDDIKKLGDITHFGNFVGKGDSPFSGAANAWIASTAQWPYLIQESPASTYFYDFMAPSSVPNLDLYRWSS